MSLRARDLLERVYDIRINPNGSYREQLEPLNSNGELGNKRAMGEVLFTLCKYVDELETRLNALELATTTPAEKKVSIIKPKEAYHGKAYKRS